MIFKYNTNLLDDKVSYIYELKNGMLLATDLSNKIKIFDFKEKQVVLYSKIETQNKTNFVGIEVSNNKIICGGTHYLIIIESTLLSWYSKNYSKDLFGFLSNLVELNSELYLVGQSHLHKISIFSNKNNEEVGEITNIYLRSNNFSISKISRDYVAIAGFEEPINSACIYIFSIEKLNVCQKFYISSLQNAMCILKLKDNEFAICGENDNNRGDLIILKFQEIKNQILIDCSYKNAIIDVEGIILNKNHIFITDSYENLNIWKLINI